MSNENDYLERLLAEHAAAKECGLLADGPTTAERSRLASLMQQAEDRGSTIEDRAAVRSSILHPPSSILYSRFPIAVGVAAVLALAIGLWVFFNRHGGQPPATQRGPVAQDTPPHKEAPRVEFLNGRGRLVPVGQDTRYTLVDGHNGRVRLDQGELFVELPAGDDLRAEIETPAGTATALETTFSAHYAEAPGLPGSPFLTIGVLRGFVEVHNPHGRAMAGAGEVVLAEGTSAPKRHAGTPPTGKATTPERGWWRFGNVVGILHRPEVQAELKLTEEQRTKLYKPAGDDPREFFRELYSVLPDERAKKAAEFRGVQEKKIAEVLDADQQRRLGQIFLQQQGYSALVNPEVADLLQLSEEQRRLVEALTRKSSQTRRSTIFGCRNWQDASQRLVELGQKESEKLAAVLTPAQQQDWQALVGPPFKLERRPGDWRDWWDSGNWWGDSGNRTDWPDYWRDPENWRGRWGGPGPGGWRNRGDSFPKHGPPR